jgi:hypothetical protein
MRCKETCWLEQHSRNCGRGLQQEKPQNISQTSYHLRSPARHNNGEVYSIGCVQPTAETLALSQKEVINPYPANVENRVSS